MLNCLWHFLNQRIQKQAKSTRAPRSFHADLRKLETLPTEGVNMPTAVRCGAVQCTSGMRPERGARSADPTDVLRRTLLYSALSLDSVPAWGSNRSQTTGDQRGLSLDPAAARQRSQWTRLLKGGNIRDKIINLIYKCFKKHVLPLSFC